MYIGITENNLISFGCIESVSYNEDSDTTDFYTKSGRIIEVAGRQHYDVYKNFLILSRNLLAIKDFTDRQENFNKIIEFHFSDPANNHEMIQMLDKADQLIKLTKEAKTRQPEQLDLFETAGNILN